MDRTREVLAEMLLENTGTHMLDSGGASGRQWQRNQGRDFEKEEQTVLSFSVYGEKRDSVCMEVTHNLLHWLGDRISLEETEDETFREFCDRPENEREPWLVLMEKYPEELRGQGHEVKGLYGEDEPMVVNTYNGSDLLSQTIQYVYFELNGVARVLLQIHGGCDARGGYTRPRLFSLDGSYGEQAIFDNAQAYICCDGDPECSNQGAHLPCIKPNCAEPGGHSWRTDDGYHWYDEESRGANLEDYDVVAPEEDETFQWEGGKFFVLPDGTGLCPLCGSKLVAYAQ